MLPLPDAGEGWGEGVTAPQNSVVIPPEAGIQRSESGVASLSLSPPRERAGVRGTPLETYAVVLAKAGIPRGRGDASV